MTLSRTKPGGWTYAEVLTSPQITAVDLNIENALDKRTAHSDTLASDVTVTGFTTFNGDTQINGTNTVTNTILMSGGKFAGAMVFPTKAVTSGPYTVDTTTADYVILVDPTSGAITINLPTATTGRVLIIKSVGNSGTNNITLHRFSSESIEGLAADYVMDADYQGVTLAAYNPGSGWFIVSTA